MERVGPEERLLRRARSPEDAAALVRFDDAMALPLVLAALLPLVLLPGSQYNLLAAAINIAAWLVFVVDFAVHERRLTSYLSTWLGRFDLTVVILTAPWFLLLGPSESKFVLIIRLARVARLVMAGAGARRLIERLGRVVIVAAGVLFVGAAIAYRAEHASNPEFASYGDSVWWAIVTLTTVGYGDIVPETEAGRVVGVMIMLTGVAVLGVLAGSLAGFFGLGGPEESEPATVDAGPPAPSAAGDEVLRTEVIELRIQIERLTDQVARLAAGRHDADG